jgi:YbbR domain-containing protein
VFDKQRSRLRQNQQWNKFADRLGTLVLSLFLALIIWLIATNQQNPLIQNPFSEPIPVSVRGLTGSTQPIQDLSEVQAEIIIRAPQRSWNTLNAGDFTAFIDLTDMEPGEHEVDVQVNGVNPQVDIVTIEPPVLRVQLDEVVSKELAIQPVVIDAPAESYIAQPPIVEPISVTVSGPKTLVTQVTSAKASISLNGAKSQVAEDNVPIELDDAQGNEVLIVVADPATAKIVVPIEQQAGRKEVAVRPNLTGEPPNGYRLSSVKVTPSTVVLEGDSATLAEVPGFVETAELSLSGATESIESRIELLLPEGVTTQEGATVSIEAAITPIQSGTTLEQKPVVQNLGPEMEASVALDTVEVILSGPQPLLESMEPDDMFVILDLADLLPGSHAVKPRVVLPPGIREEGLLPETVEVVIVSIEAETPGPVMTSTATITSTTTPAPVTTVTVTTTTTSEVETQPGEK